MTPNDRFKLFQDVLELPSVLFGQLIFTLGIPNGWIPPDSASQGDRTNSFLFWADGSQGPGLTEVRHFVDLLTGKALTENTNEIGKVKKDDIYEHCRDNENIIVSIQIEINDADEIKEVYKAVSDLLNKHQNSKINLAPATSGGSNEQL